MPNHDPGRGSIAQPARWLLPDIGGVLEIVDDEVRPSRFRARWAARLGLSESELHQRLEAADLPDLRTNSGVAARFWTAYAAALGAPSHSSK